MVRRMRWVLLGIVLVVGLYALTGALLSFRYERKAAVLLTSEAYADLQRRGEDVPSGENAVACFTEAAALLQQVPEEHATYTSAWAWDPDELERIFAPPEEVDGEEVFGPYASRREEMKSALPALDPFVAALATALERPAVQYPAKRSKATDTLRFARNMLPVRARLMPDRAAESADLLLRLATRWQTRDKSELLDRYDVLREALRIVRDLLARDPVLAEPYAGAWREWLAAEDPLAEFRFQCAVQVRSTVHTVEEVRCGEDPFAPARKSLQEIEEKMRDVPPGDREVLMERMNDAVETPWFFRWWARLVFYWGAITALDNWKDAIDSAHTDEGLRGFLDGTSVGPFDRVVGVQTLEQIALARIARVALSVAAGDAPPELEDPFTGRPLAMRREGGVTVISATLPERFRDRFTAPELYSWEVRR